MPRVSDSLKVSSLKSSGPSGDPFSQSADWSALSALEPTRACGLRLLDEFAEVAQNYADRRSFAAGNLVCVSHLSPFLRYRLLSEWEVIGAVLKKNPANTVQKFISEVCWRTYWKGWMETHPQCWDEYLRQIQEAKSLNDPDFQNRLEAAVMGRTNLDCFNDWVDELKTTGYLHNSVRMWFASIWIFTFSLPWPVGAAFFQRHLLDGDPASNTLSWRWIAGLHTRGKHYLVRPSTISKYSGHHHPLEGLLTEDADALEEDFSFPYSPLSSCAKVEDVELPSLSASPAGLLVTPDDLLVEQGPLADAPFGSIAVLAGNDIHDSLDLAMPVRAFIDGAVEDAAKRINRHWQGNLVPLSPEGLLPFEAVASPHFVSNPTILRTYFGTVEDWTKSVLNWAIRENLKTVRMYEPPQGAYAAKIPELRLSFRRLGINFCLYRRRWDDLHWPHADKGYFPFRKNLLRRLAEYGLPV